jgi:RNA polymerase sigma-70 factor (ECF subfamily)
MQRELTAEQRFSDFFERNHRPVYAYCRRRIDAATAADCAAETFLVAWRRFDEIPDGDRALSWLFGVARRVIANQVRSEHRLRGLLTRMAVVQDASGSSVSEIVVRRAQDREVVEALGRIGLRDREVLLLAVWEDLPHAEIGEILGCSTHAVDQRIHRANRRLARELRRSNGRIGPRHPTESVLGEEKT